MNDLNKYMHAKIYIKEHENGMFALGLSPRTNPEKTKISEHYRKMQEVIAAESHQKMTRLTQRRHSTCQKMNRLDRKNSGKNTSGHTSSFGSNRTLGLKKQLDQIDTEIHETVIQSKVRHLSFV